MVARESSTSCVDERVSRDDDGQLPPGAEKDVLKLMPALLVLHDRPEQRNFSSLALLGLACSILQTWEATLLLFSQGLANGGPAGTIYGFLLVWAGNLSVFSTLSELASSAPTSAGQHHWVAVLAPPSCANFLSYMTGWLVVAGWQGTVASALYVCASLIQTLAELNVPAYSPEAFHATLLFWACLAVVFLLNAWNTRFLAAFEMAALTLHIAGFVAMLVTLVVLAPRRNTAADVFSAFANAGGWSSQGMSVLVGLIGNVFAFAGALFAQRSEHEAPDFLNMHRPLNPNTLGVDGSFHMSEETRNAALVVPRSTVVSLVINGALGLGILLAVVFSLDDARATSHAPHHFPFVDVLLHTTQSATATSVLMGLVLMLGAAGCTGLFASAARVMWSFARDQGLPCWRTLRKIRGSSGPLWSIGCTALICFLLSLINLGSTIAFNSVVSLAVSCLSASYLVASLLLLIRRLRADPFPWGPWRIPRPFGLINNILACIYLVLVLVFAFFPPTAAVDAATMNYSVLVTGTTVLFAIVYYVVWGRRLYRGALR